MITKEDIVVGFKFKVGSGGYYEVVDVIDSEFVKLLNISSNRSKPFNFKTIDIVIDINTGFYLIIYQPNVKLIYIETL
jgi:hypothetical protein